MLVATVKETEEGERAAVLLAAVVEGGAGGRAVLFAAGEEREEDERAVLRALVEVLSSSKPKSRVNFRGTETCLLLRRGGESSELIVARRGAGSDGRERRGQS